MAYATYSDIAALIPELPSIQTPSRAEINVMCVRYSHFVDAAYNKLGYTVPITNADDIGMFSQFIARKVAADVLRAVYRGQGTESTQSATIWEEDWKLFTNMLTNGLLPLINQTVDGGGLGVMYSRRHNPDDE